MGVIDEIYADLDADVSEEEFREAVETKVEQMGGLADEETAAMLVAHEVGEGEVETIADVAAGMSEAKFLGKVTRVGELHSFARTESSEPEPASGEPENASGEPETASGSADAGSGGEHDIPSDNGDAGSDVGTSDDDVTGAGGNEDEYDVDYADNEAAEAEAEAEAEEVEVEEEGYVLNLTVADETGSVRVALWDERARGAADELEPGDVVRVRGRPKDGPRGLEVNADRLEIDEESEVDVDTGDTLTVESLSLGQSDVNLRGVVLDTESVRTFDRDDGSEGRVANMVLGDETGRVRLTLWDEKADLVNEFEAGTSVEAVDGYVRERDGRLELHVGSRGTVEAIDEQITYVPDTDDIADVEIGETVDIAGVVRSADPKRTFDRDDGSEGQVRNVRVQDRTGDIRVALWGEKADTDVGPGDEILVADVEIQDGWQDELEASAGWRSTVSVLEDEEAISAGASAGAGAGAGRIEGPEDSPGSGDSPGSTDSAGSATSPDESTSRESTASAGGTDDSTTTTGLSSFAEGGGGDGGSASSAGDGSGSSAGDGSGSSAGGGGQTFEREATEEADEIEITGTVVQTGDPVIVDTDDETYTIETDEDVHLGEQVTVRGRSKGDRITADDVF